MESWYRGNLKGGELVLFVGKWGLGLCWEISASLFMLYVATAIEH